MNNIIEKLPINWALIGNPANWLIIWVMVAVGYAGLKLIHSSTENKE